MDNKWLILHVFFNCSIDCSLGPAYQQAKSFTFKQSMFRENNGNKRQEQKLRWSCTYIQKKSIFSNFCKNGGHQKAAQVLARRLEGWIYFHDTTVLGEKLQYSGIASTLPTSVGLKDTKFCQHRIIQVGTGVQTHTILSSGKAICDIVPMYSILVILLHCRVII